MSVNKVILIGNLGKDPEIRYTNAQIPVCTFSLATNERRKEGGNWVDHTEWHNIIVFGKAAENCGNFLKKGRQAYIEGKIQTRKWKDKEGRDRYTTEILANTVQFIGARGERGEGGFSGGSEANAGMGAAAMGSDIGISLPSADSLSDSSTSAALDDDDIPF